jgi:hypothetical protein
VFACVIAYSTLFHIRPDGAVAIYPLSRSSGELDKDTRASWGARRRPVDRAGDRLTGHLEPLAEALPTADDRWIVGVPFRTEAAASRRAAGAAVQRYPR